MKANSSLQSPFNYRTFVRDCAARTDEHTHTLILQSEDARDDSTRLNDSITNNGPQ